MRSPCPAARAGDERRSAGPATRWRGTTSLPARGRPLERTPSPGPQRVPVLDPARLGGDGVHHVHDRLDGEGEGRVDGGEVLQVGRRLGLDDGVPAELAEADDELVEGQALPPSNVAQDDEAPEERSRNARRTTTPSGRRSPSRRVDTARPPVAAAPTPEPNTPASTATATATSTGPAAPGQGTVPATDSRRTSSCAGLPTVPSDLRRVSAGIGSIARRKVSAE